MAQSRPGVRRGPAPSSPAPRPPDPAGAAPPDAAGAAQANAAEAAQANAAEAAQANAAGAGTAGTVPAPNAGGWRLRRALTGLVCAQSAGLLFAAVFLFVRGAQGGAYDSGSARLGAGMALLGAVALGVLAWASWRRRTWATSPLVVIELLSIPVAVSLLQAGQPAYGAPLLVSAGVALVLVVASGMLTAQRPAPASAASAAPGSQGAAESPRPATPSAARRGQPRKRRR